jgi:hypothetical protein
MKYQRDLKVLLQERYKRLYRASDGTYAHEVRYFYTFLQKHPVLQALMHSIENASPTFDPAQWIETQYTQATPGGFDWPQFEEQRAKVLLTLLRNWAADGSGVEEFGQCASDESDLGAQLQDVTQRVVAPFVEYLQDRLSEDSDILYLLERYKRRIEWFEQQRLFAAYEKDTVHGEAIYDEDLRLFLFEQGVDCPFSQPHSPSGNADVVADIQGDDPLVCEVKLFGAGQYGIPYVAKGVKQALRYARDYNKVSGYLVVFNLSVDTLDLPTDASDRPWPPRLQVEEHVIFLVVIQARPLPTASTRGKLSIRTVTRQELLDELTPGDAGPI